MLTNKIKSNAFLFGNIHISLMCWILFDILSTRILIKTEASFKSDTSGT